jgi:uncharacterized lipoprotein YajG
MRIVLPSLLATVMLAACSMPATTVETVSEKPRLQFSGAPADAEVVIDGTALGKAQDFDGHRQNLLIATGMHRVVVRTPVRLLFAQDIYIGPDMTKTIALSE